LRVRFTDRALEEFEAQADWLAARSPAAAWKARHRILATLAWLADFPLAAPRVDEIHRDAAVRFGRDGFFVRYRLEGDDLVVVRVYHGRQDR
jgi:plasmid stabilization system protein ParE